MRKASITLIVLSVLLGVFGYFKPGLRIEYVRDVEACVTAVESYKTGSRTKTGIGKSNGVRYNLVTFTFTDENGFEQTVEQKIPAGMYEHYHSLIGKQARTYRLYEADIDTDNDSGSGFYLTEKIGKEAETEYKKAHSLFVHKTAQMFCVICLLCGGFTLWLSLGSKKHKKSVQS